MSKSEDVKQCELCIEHTKNEDSVCDDCSLILEEAFQEWEQEMIATLPPEFD